MVRTQCVSVSLGAPEGLSFEPLLVWICKIMRAYQEHDEPENDPFSQKTHAFSTGYYTKKVN